MRISDLSDRKSSTIIQEKYDSGGRKHGLSKRVRKQTAEKGAKDAVIEGDQRERYKSAIPESYLLANVIKIEFPNMEEGRAVSADSPVGSFVIYVCDVRPAGAIVDIQ